MDIQEKEVLIAEIERFKEEAMKSYIVSCWAESYTNTDPFGYVVLENKNNKVWWLKTQAYQLWEMWQAAKAKSDKKIKLLLCDEHLQKCESPTGIFNSQYPDEEPCLICLAKQAKAQAVPGWVSVEDKLPIDGQDVIAFDAIKHCVFKGGEFLQGYIESDTGHEYEEPVEVTHWMAVEAQEPTND